MLRIAAPALAAGIVLTVMPCVGGCQSAAPQRPQESAPTTSAHADLDRLARWMSGSFTSAAQAERDPDFRVIDLHMTPIWSDRTDGRWLYVEQAAATARDKPYRQRVYRVTADETASAAGAPLTRLRSDVYEFAGDPLRFAGAWSDIAKLGDLRPDDLVIRDGCSITMRPEGDAFVGGTEGDACPSSLRGASHATSEVRVTDGLLLSWDRGWDASGTQVWGAVTGGYEFVRIAKGP